MNRTLSRSGRARRRAPRRARGGRLRLERIEGPWRRHLPGLDRLLRRLDPLLPAEIRLILTEDRVLRALKRRYFGHDAPTNVLSFPDPGSTSGEVLLALGVLRREAAAQGKRLGDHLAHLILHGALHVAGHDHHHPAAARRMERLEARLLRRAGFANPWRGVF